MHRAQTCFAHIYYPINIFPMRSMVCCCVWSWLGTPYALWDGAKFRLPCLCQAAQRSLLWNTCSKKPGVSRQLIPQLLLPFSLNQTSLGAGKPTLRAQEWPVTLCWPGGVPGWAVFEVPAHVVKGNWEDRFLSGGTEMFFVGHWKYIQIKELCFYVVQVTKSGFEGSLKNTIWI